MSFEKRFKSEFEEKNAQLDAATDRLAAKGVASKWTGAALVILAILVGYVLYLAFR